MAQVKLVSKQFGAGEPVVILHGLFGSSINWRRIAQALGETHRAFIVDLRNHGDSPRSKEMSYSAMAADIACFIEADTGGSAHVIGHSMGGKAAMVLALTRPEAVRRLMVVDIAPVPYADDHGHLVDAMQALDLSRIGSRREAEHALSGAIEESALRLFLLHNLKQTPDGFRWQINLPVLKECMEAMMDFPKFGEDIQFKGPVTMLYGEQSDYDQEKDHTLITHLFPAVRFKAVPETGHWLHAEKPELVIREIQNWLK